MLLVSKKVSIESGSLEGVQGIQVDTEDVFLANKRKLAVAYF